MYYTKEEIAQMTNEILIQGQIEKMRREDEAQMIKEKQVGCIHLRLKCTNNVFYCLDCGAMVPNPYEAEKQEAPKPGRKRKAKGDDGNENH